MRLQKYLADAGVASRRKAEEMIAEGRVEVNGETVCTPGFIVDDRTDIIKCDGRIVNPISKKVYIMLNKPEGCVTSAKDQFGRRTVMDYVRDVKERIVPVGRLDYDTSGLLLLTNDGELMYRLTHPKHEIKKTYVALVNGMPSPTELHRLRRGINVDGRKTVGAEVKVIEANQKESRLEITIHEGRNRQVRKMCEGIGHSVIKLYRIRYGGLSLGDLKKGEHRFLTKDEIDNLKKITALENPPGV